MNNTIRNLQIDLIMDNPNPIIDKFNSILQYRNILETEVYHRLGGELIYYNENYKWIFYTDDKRNIFYCNKKVYWDVIAYNFKFSNLQVKEITTILTGHFLKSNITNPYPLTFSYNERIEKILKKLSDE